MTDPAPSSSAPPGSEQREKTRGRALPHARHAAQAAAVAVVAALLGLLIWKIVAGNPGAGLVDSIRRGNKPSAPGFVLPVIWTGDSVWSLSVDAALADGRLRLSELRGHPVVLNFWASWCIPCREEAPALAASARAHRGDVVFLGLDVQDLTADARRFLRRHNVPYASVRESGSAVYRAYGLTGVPETYYIDRQGRIVAHSIGKVSRAELEEGVRAALQERD